MTLIWKTVVEHKEKPRRRGEGGRTGISSKIEKNDNPEAKSMTKRIRGRGEAERKEMIRKPGRCMGC